MNDLESRFEVLRRRLRFQSAISVGVLVILMFAMGGADTVARALIDVPVRKALAPAVTGTTETWRLEYTSSSQITLRGIGNGSGVIEIGGVFESFTASPTLGAQSPVSTLYYIYAFMNGTTVTLEASTTQPTLAQYGVYATKGNGEYSKRFVGMAYTTVSGTYTPDMVRSALNEQGYAWKKKYAPATAVEPFTSSTTWVDLDSNVRRDGLFFDGERVEVWTMVMNYVAPNWTTRECRLGVSFDAVAIDDSESGVTINRGLNSYALPFSVQRAEAYVTTSGAGGKLLKAIHRGTSGGASDFYISSSYPASIGFEVIR